MYSSKKNWLCYFSKIVPIKQCESLNLTLKYNTIYTLQFVLTLKICITNISNSSLTTKSSSDCTEVGRAFLIHLKKWFLNKVFIRIKIARKFKFYIWIIISGNKSVKKGQKMPKKATNWTYNAFSKKNFVLANLK